MNVDKTLFSSRDKLIKNNLVAVKKSLMQFIAIYANAAKLDQGGTCIRRKVAQCEIL
jgi:hypothetical protein